jgi:hypothetical protein
MTGRGGWRFGSGRPGKHIQVEHCRHIDVRLLHRSGMLAGPWIGQWSWREPTTLKTTARIDILVKPPVIQLTYRWQGQLHIDQALLLQTPCRLGGSRPWFSCPGCRKRVAKLYFVIGKFRCRGCHCLRYRSQSLASLDRIQQSKQRLEDGLGPHWRRLRGMHQSTHNKIVGRIIDLEMARDDELFSALTRLSP